MTKNDRVPPYVRKLLDNDAVITKKVIDWCANYLLLRALCFYNRILEISCHGVPWFSFWISFTWLFDKTYPILQLQVNILLALLIDVIIVAMMKAYFRRKRPITDNQDILNRLTFDVYSFPSGHASRSVMVSFIFINIFGVSGYVAVAIVIWVACVCLSRIMMRRHYLLDVVGGILLGLFEGLLMKFLWLSINTSYYIMSKISDEYFEGGEFDV